MEGGKLKNEGFFFFFFFTLKTQNLVLGLQKWKFLTGKKTLHVREKKIRENYFAPLKNIPVTPLIATFHSFTFALISHLVLIRKVRS